MLTFNTQFPINSSRSIGDLLETIKTWQINSPHTTLPKEEIKNISQTEDATIKNQNESLQTLIIHKEKSSLLGAKHTTIQDSVRWTTEITGSKKEYSFWISIQVSCDNSLPTHKIPNTKKPHIIKLILEHLGGGFDGDLKVQKQATELNSKQIDIAKSIIIGESSNLMPTVYVSATNEDKPLVNVEKLAYHLSGMAHLLVEPNRDFSFNLKYETAQNNAYGGAVAIYWPEGLGRYLFLPWGKYESPEQIELETQQVIRSALLSMRPLKECTWQYVTEQKTRTAIEALKSKGSVEIDQYIALFDSETASLREEISKLERENHRLKSQAFARNSENEQVDLLVPSAETDLYHGEHQDIIIEALESLASSIPDKCRRKKDVIKGILDKNKKVDAKLNIIKTIKDILSNYQKMDEKTKRTLERLGFTITSDGTHYKLLFNSDSRYPIIIAKTPSDFRAGKNTASDMSTILF